MACGIWLKVSHQPRIEAEAMIRKMMPVMRVVRTDHFIKIFEGERPIDYPADKQRIGNGDGGSLGRGCNAAQNRTENEDRQHQRQNAFAKGAEDRHKARPFLRFRQIELFTQRGDHRHANEADQQAGQDPGSKQTGNRNSHDRAIDHRQRRGRNGRPDDRSGSGNSAGKRLGIALLDHGGYQRIAESGSVRCLPRR